MRYAPEDVPWQRVVGAGGRLPIARRSPELKLLQLRILMQEGVVFHAGDPDRIDMAISHFTVLCPIEDAGDRDVQVLEATIAG